jgi:hypothetical protein
LGGLSAAATAEGTATAEEMFRVENKVFIGAAKEPQVRSTTIFYQGVVYDYLEDPAEVTVFDKARGRFVLLDPQRRIKTELTTARVEDFSERLRQWAHEQSDPLLNFHADPHFSETVDEATGELVFDSPRVVYRVSAVEAGSEAVASRYREFSDWYGRLNTMLNPGARPPFPRMLVSRSLEQREQIPRAVELTLRPRDILSRPISARSEHLLIRRLLESDRNRMAETDRFMAMFEAVDFVDYQRRLGNESR